MESGFRTGTYVTFGEKLDINRRLSVLPTEADRV